MRVEHLAEGVTLHLADCREVDWPAVDAVVTSPPYNCGKDYGTASDDLDLAEYEAFLRGTVFAIDAARTVVNVGNYIGSRKDRVLTRDVLARSATMPVVDEIIWDKGPANGAAWGNYPTSPRIRAQHEMVYVYGDKAMRESNGLSWAEWSALTTSIWRISANVNLAEHPAQMPVLLAEKLVRLYSPLGGTVADPFLGSGTTAVAAIKHGRQFVGSEIDPLHFDNACRRISAILRQPDMFTPRQQQPKQEAMF